MQPAADALRLVFYAPPRVFRINPCSSDDPIFSSHLSALKQVFLYHHLLASIVAFT